MKVINQGEGYTIMYVDTEESYIWPKHHFLQEGYFKDAKRVLDYISTRIGLNPIGVMSLMVAMGMLINNGYTGKGNRHATEKSDSVKKRYDEALVKSIEILREYQKDEEGWDR